MGEKISAATARRAALSAQGFGGAKPAGTIGKRHGRKLFDQIGLIQVDSVNVLVRSQELPIFARLGPHSRDLLPSMIRSNELFEYWAHEASLLPVGMHHLFRWKMTPDSRKWQSVQQLAKDHPGYVESVLAEVVDRGPLAAGELSDAGGPKRGSWWDWSKGKVATS